MTNTNKDIARQRLYHQRLSTTTFTQPDKIVQWMGAVQSQDYAAAKWTIAQRSNGLTEAAIDEAFNSGAILRTHVLRPTWHFVTPADIRWMLTLTAPRVAAAMAYYNRAFGLTAAIFKRTGKALERILKGGRQLTRIELIAELKHAGIDAGKGERPGLMMLQAELDGIICSGARKGKQFTYALLDERAPQTKQISRQETLGELARRYFQGHGPATLKDFSWWSGLTIADAAAGMELVQPALLQETINGQTYWFTHEAIWQQSAKPVAHLLANFDEFTVGYADRSALYEQGAPLPSMALLGNIIVVNGQITGTWQRRLKKNKVIIETKSFVQLSQAKTKAVNAAVNRYGKFLGLEVEAIVVA